MALKRPLLLHTKSRFLAALAMTNLKDDVWVQHLTKRGANPLNLRVEIEKRF